MPRRQKCAANTLSADWTSLHRATCASVSNINPLRRSTLTPFASGFATSSQMVRSSRKGARLVADQGFHGEPVHTQRWLWWRAGDDYIVGRERPPRLAKAGRGVSELALSSAIRRAASLAFQPLASMYAASSSVIPTRAFALESKMESNGRAGMEKSVCSNGLLQGSIPPAPAKSLCFRELRSGWQVKAALIA